MLSSILRKTSSITGLSSSSPNPSSSSSSDHHQPIADDWEIIDEDRYSFDGDDDEATSGESGSKPDPKPLAQIEVAPPPVVVKEAPYVAEPEEEEEVAEEDEDDDDDDVYGDEVDDHLVPWAIKGRFGKQRITKMGKRGDPKFNRANKLPCYYHNRPYKALPRRQPVVFG